MTSLEQRVASLERKSRWWKLSTGVLAAGLLATWALGAGERPTREIRANRFTLVSEAGVELGGIIIDKHGGPQLVMNNTNGKTVVSLSTAADGAIFSLLKDENTPVALLQASEKGGLLSLQNQQGKVIMAAAPEKNGAGTLFVANAKGDDMVTMVGLPTGGAVVISNAENQKSLVLLSKDNKGYVEAYDADGKVSGTLRRSGE